VHEPTEDKVMIQTRNLASIQSILKVPYEHCVRKFQYKKREGRYSPTKQLGMKSLHESNNNNGVRVVNIATSQNLSRVQCSHITTFVNTLGLLLTGKHNQTDHVLIYERWHSNIVADDVNILVENTNTIRKNRETLLEARTEVVVEVNTEKTKYMVVSHHHNAGQNHNSLTANKCFGNVTTFKCLGTTVTNHNCIHKEIKRRLNFGNMCYHSLQNLLSSHLLPKNLEIKTHKSIILPVVLYRYKTWCLTLSEEHTVKE